MGVKKDFTDFILLDNIYQKALSTGDIEVFILFSGDGHFSSAMSFLKNFYSKEVGIYGIKGCFSRQLQDSANWCVTLPNDEDVYGSHFRLIFEALKNAKNAMTTQGLISSITLKHKTVTPRQITDALLKLTSEGYISERKITFHDKNANLVLFVDWDRVKRGNFFE